MRRLGAIVLLLVAIASGASASSLGPPRAGGGLRAVIADSSAITNTLIETAFDKSLTIPAEELNVAGTVLRVRASGRYSTVGAPTLTLTVRFGGTDLFQRAMLTSNAASNLGWTAEADLLVRTIGATGSCILVRGHIALTGATGGIDGGPASLAPFTCDLTTQNVVDLTAQWGTQSASNTIVQRALTTDSTYAVATVN